MEYIFNVYHDDFAEDVRKETAKKCKKEGKHVDGGNERLLVRIGNSTCKF